ncbi:MAG: CdiI immunity protein [Bacteroidota bacterium]|jgi:hypothetical protein
MEYKLEDNLKNVANFFGSRFHNMWPEEYGTWENAVDDFCQQASVDWLRIVRAELILLIDEKYDEEKLDQIVTERCHANFYAPGDNLTYQQWLEKVDDILRNWIEKKSIKKDGGN